MKHRAVDGAGTTHEAVSSAAVGGVVSLLCSGCGDWFEDTDAPDGFTAHLTDIETDNQEAPPR